MDFKNYADAAMIDGFQIAELQCYWHGQFEFGIQIDAYRRDNTKNLLAANELVLRIQCLTMIANSSTISTHDLMTLCKRVTGKVPNPIDLSKPNGD